MKSVWVFPLSAALGSIGVAVLGQAGPGEQKARTLTLEGKLVVVADMLEKKYGVKLDEDAAETLVAVQRQDGTLLPVLKNTGSQMFFHQKRLRGRHLRITGRRYPGLDMLDVVGFSIVQGDKRLEAFYWCDTCAIKVHRPGVCPCCPDPVVYREEPIKP